MIAVIDYKKGNLKSVERGLRFVGADACITDSPDDIKRADAIVLPGVGAFTDAMSSVRELRQDEAIFDAMGRGIPFLGICLGMHLMFEGGEEHAHGNTPTAGLGIIPGVVRAMPKTDEAGCSYKIPHVGWNSVELSSNDNPLFSGIDDGSHFYFTHSYIAPDSTYTIATTTHSVTFPCAVQSGNTFGVQFHPEKSSDVGMQLLENFVRLV